MKIDSYNLKNDFVVLDPKHHSTTVKCTPTVYKELDNNFNGFKEHLLVSSFEFDSDWESWENHPNGDEIVILQSGNVDFILETDEGNKKVTLDTSGSYIIVPKNTWHTAKTSVQTQMIFLTSGEGTLHRRNK